ncbi:NAD(P)H-binding protein [Mycolicibacterium sediminis]|uniref:NAD(P)-binding domain-containing protein n=1 Tax=Mycolicibacterium sediminis TaxID=1286180 RepID=A0A7I7QQS3_9MYCO|nr:NAD(P)H-binding protein [Mycolicibacterium sediminis]BBY28186.1 hypothetical protein MSEDJ_22820 [Mycolicibacterium sediminis]
MSENRLTCLVTGSTGYVGGRLIPRLLAAGHRVKAMARDPRDLDSVPWRDDVDVVRADLADPESLDAACAGVDVLYYLVHSMGTSSDFESEEADSATNTVEAARRAGVRRVVYLGGLHPSGGHLSKHLESRSSVGDTLLASGIETVALQAGVVIGAGSASFEMIRHLVEVSPVLPVPRWSRHLVQPIAVDDVLHYLTEAATASVPTSRTWDIGGPNVLRYADVLREFGDVAGLPPRRIVPVPGLTPAIVSWGIALLTPMPAGLVRPLVASLKSDSVMGDRDVDTVIAPPAKGLTTYRNAVARALEQPYSDDSGVQPTDPSAAELMPSDPEWARERTAR